MTSSAAAARGASVVSGVGAGPTLSRLGLVVAGGLVEGTALGLLQYLGLRRWLNRLRRTAWVGTTVAVAGLGWALASIPAAISDDSAAPAADSGPSWMLLVLGGLGLGAVMGAVLGGAQAVVLRAHVRRPRRWVLANAAAWAPAMAIILIGASSPSASWATPQVIVLGTFTGLLAGAVLGLVTGLWLPSLMAGTLYNRAVMMLLRTDRSRWLQDSLIGLRVTGRRTGRVYEFPVQTASGPTGIVVLPGHADSKTWWRNLDVDTPVDLLSGGRWHAASATLLRRGDAGYFQAVDLYRKSWLHVKVPDDAPIVVITTTAAASGRPTRNSALQPSAPQR